MKILRMHFPQWAVLLIIGLVLTGYPLPGQAMSLFMGGEEQKPAAPPPKPAAAKPQAAPGQPDAKPTAPTTTSPATGAPAPASATAPAAGAPKPAGTQPATPPAMPAPPAQAGGAAKELPKPAATVGVPPVPGVPGTPVAAAAPAPTAVEAMEGYSYDPKSRRDPFQSLTRLIKVDKTRAEMPPLQRIQISDLKLLGIMWGGYGYYGLVQTPDGKGYTVKEGMLMGTNNGVITTITDKAIIVSEPSVDITGKKITKDLEILLRPKEVS